VPLSETNERHLSGQLLSLVLWYQLKADPRGCVGRRSEAVDDGAALTEIWEDF